MKDKIPDLSSLRSSYIKAISTEESDKDAIIACNIVRLVFQNINDCCQRDRSAKKLNMIEKGLIKSMLGEKTLKGIDDYLVNMYPADVKKLMDEIEIEVSKRKS